MGLRACAAESASERAFDATALAAATTSAPSVGSPLISQPPPLDHRRVRGQHARHQQLAQAGVGAAGAPSIGRELAARRVARAADLEVLAGGDNSRTVISSLVSVPVLSEQITEVLPSVSTAGSRRISAWCLTIFCTPMASEMVTTAGKRLGHHRHGQRDAEDQHLDQRSARAADPSAR
jgi:hypothetical protein